MTGFELGCGIGAKQPALPALCRAAWNKEASAPESRCLFVCFFFLVAEFISPK